MNLIIFDLETTGLSPYNNDIIQIAGVKVKSGCWDQTEAFETFVRPRRPVPTFITKLTGITQAQVDCAPSASAALQSFSRFVGGEDTTLIAHNGLRFDMQFIRQSCLRHGLPVRETGFIDSLAFSRLLWHGRGHGLDAVMLRLGVTAAIGQRRHDARGDVQMLTEAVRRMWGRLCPDFSSCPVPRGAGVIPMLS